MMTTRLICIWTLAATASAALPEKVGFNEHIRPLLSNNCFYCHGPDSKTREADLRIDTRDGAIADLGGYAAVLPGKPDDSELLKRIITHDEDDIMPPTKSKKPRFTADQVALIRRWIEQGAEYEGHWSFLPVSKAEPPVVKDDSWVKTPIDRFVLAQLERAGITPSPEADAATLCRRLYLDLTGLLPSPAEAGAFAKAFEEDRDKAVAALADRLLASPHYGERWGRHWLDQARYADSNGYAVDGERVMWPYRDWVIAALNADMPFDRFTIEQLAGDLLPNPTKAQLVATGFHRNTLINQEGGSDPEQFRVEAAIDRVNTTGAVWLGLTVGCAQCHTHKFDPIQHREFYGLYAFFNSGTDVNNKGATVQVVEGEMFGREAKGVSAVEIAKLRADWEKAELARLDSAQPESRGAVEWQAVEFVEFDTESNAGFRKLADNSLLTDGRGSFNDTYRVVVKTKLPKIAAVRLRVLTDESLPKGGPGTAGNGNFVLTEFDAAVAGVDVPFSSAKADHEQPDFPASAAIDGDAKSGWAINVGKGSKAKMNANHEAVFVLAKPLELNDGVIEFRLRHGRNERYLIGRFALDISGNAPAISSKSDPLLTALKLPDGERSKAQRKLLDDAFGRAVPASGQKEKVVEQMVMEDLPEVRETYVFQRGDFLRPDKEQGRIQPGVIAAVSAAFNQPATKFANRLDLAKWLVSPENPLTSRVTVNRVWMRYFGRGLVETEEDFGTQGTPPTHPALLDWMAAKLISDGWSMKRLHRLIVTSATYRQSSAARADLAERDPRNLLLARQERIRVDAEVVRDAALCASGLIDLSVGGPGFFPPQPEGVYAFTQNAKKWNTSPAPDRFRRGMYTVFFRSAPHPLFGTFDVPNMQTTCTRRVRSNTPLQSLTMANDVAFLEIAQGLAGRLASEAKDLDARLRLGFLLTVCREPSADELRLLRDYTVNQQQDFEKDTASAKALTPAGVAGLPSAEAAALVCAARVLINTDGFITRE